MKRRFVLLGFLSLLATHLAAQTVQAEPPFTPPFPSSMAVGNALVASASGFDSLYSNPAGFARGKPALTLATAAPGLFMTPSIPNFERLGAAWRTPAEAAQLLAPIYAAGGFGGSAAAGIGYTGSGLGLGLVASAGGWGAGPGDMTGLANLAFIGGLAFNLGKHFTIGGDVRPMFRVHVPSASIGELLSFVQAPESTAAGVMALFGVAVGLDLGAIATFGPFSYGLALSDIGGTSFYYAEDSLSALTSSIASGGGLPSGQSVGTNYTVPMRAILGVAYQPDLSRLFRPRFEIDYAYSFAPAPQPADAISLLDGLRAGVDVGLLSVLHLRAGYQHGSVSAGVGLALPGIQIDATGFQQIVPTESLGPSQGIAAGVSIRF